MTRDYSKNACASCKRRRKKCGEEKPVCSGCTRNNLTCSYESSSKSRFQQQTSLTVGPLQLCIPASEVTSIQPPYAQDGDESRILCRIPGSVQAFYSPTCRYAKPDLQMLWQMMLQDDLVHNSMVACWSVILGRDAQLGVLNRRAYGKALQQLQAKISLDSFNSTDLLSTSLGVLFAGLLESLGPEAYTDPLQHWKALIYIAGTKPLASQFDWRTLPQNLAVLILEGLLFHLSCLGMFSKDVILLEKLWKHAKLDEKLDQVNPEGPDRSSKSTFLSGQYVAYRTILSITCLHRTRAEKAVSPSVLDRMESSILGLEDKIDDSFTRVVQWRNTPADVQILRNEYRIIYQCIRIGIDTLRIPTQQTVQKVDDIVASALRLFCNLPLLPISHGGLVWAIQLLACAIRSDQDFKTLELGFDRLKQYLDPGHQARAGKLLARLRDLRRSATDAESLDVREGEAHGGYSSGILLLRQKNGLLS